MLLHLAFAPSLCPPPQKKIPASLCKAKRQSFIPYLIKYPATEIICNDRKSIVGSFKLYKMKEKKTEYKNIFQSTRPVNRLLQLVCRFITACVRFFACKRQNIIIPDYEIGHEDLSFLPEIELCPILS